MRLEQFFQQHSKAALAFSGGTDSSLLLYEGIKCGCDIRPYFVKTAFQPQFELDDAFALCTQLGVGLSVIELDIFANRQVIENQNERCYFCKKSLLGNLISAAKADGYDEVIDGTNASDDALDRPGMRALSEMGIISPLRRCEITKDEVRKMSELDGLFTAKKPSYACLATRIPSGTEITAQMLDSVEKSEDFMTLLGFSDFRVRVNGDIAKIQLPRAQFSAAMEKSEQIYSLLSQYFKDVVLDLKPR
ncbi:MAG: ATP-dependent sacrificial sulfur transferase LarE [Oscillospiraceae bacterium]